MWLLATHPKAQAKARAEAQAAFAQLPAEGAVDDEECVFSFYVFCGGGEGGGV